MKRIIGFTVSICILIGLFVLGYNQYTYVSVLDLNNPSDWSVKKLTYHAAHGDIDASVILGTLYEQGLKVPKDPEKALKYYMMASLKGSDIGSLNAGRLLKNTDPLMASKFFALSAQKGNVTAKQQLGLLMISSDPRSITIYDPKIALKWFKSAAMDGDTISMINMSNIYNTGLNPIPINYNESLHWTYIAMNFERNPQVKNSLSEDIKSLITKTGDFYEKNHRLWDAEIKAINNRIILNSKSS